jgi:flagellar biosynthetic protein FlhB
MATLLMLLSAGLVVIAVIDWPIQYVRRLSQLKMTSQEMRDEHKQTEGAPEKKAAIRQRQRDMARGGVAKSVKQAQFVLTNPSHFSVAMAYDPAVAPAPYVLAKGPNTACPGWNIRRWRALSISPRVKIRWCAPNSMARSPACWPS